MAWLVADRQIFSLRVDARIAFDTSGVFWAEMENLIEKVQTITSIILLKTISGSTFDPNEILCKFALSTGIGFLTRGYTFGKQFRGIPKDDKRAVDWGVEGLAKWRIRCNARKSLTISIKSNYCSR